MGNTVGLTNETNRVQWIEQTLKKIPEGYHILDAGAGECQFKKFCTHLHYTSQDFAQYTGEGNTGLQTGTWDNTKLDIVSDITSIPRPNESFDAIMCTEVLEHVPNPIAAITELNRLLKPGGYLLITAPFSSLTHFAPYHFSSGFNRFFYEHHLGKLGYNFIELSFNGNYFEVLAQELRRVNTVAKKYSGIKLGFLARVNRYLFLNTLQKLSKKDKGSNELFAYGIHVFAQKGK
jgi:ubiquinone/menaquinone biosynthesis C-methylase UbiE